MSVSIFLVEDESWIRKGIKKMIRWQELDVQLIGEADNGVDARTQILALQPQIIISDIRIPLLDGLELVRQVMLKINVKVIFISGYKEFEYARQAVELDAVSYLLKPLDAEELNRTLRQTIDKIYNEQQQKWENDYGKATFLMNALDDRLNETVWQKMHPQVTEGYYRVLMIPVSEEMLQDAARDEFKRCLEQLSCACLVKSELFVKNRHEYVIIFSSGKDWNFEKHTESVARKFREHLPCTQPWAFGEVVGCLEDIPLSYNHAWLAYAHRDDKNDGILKYEPDQQAQIVLPDSAKVERIKFSVETGDTEKLHFAVLMLKQELLAHGHPGMQSLSDYIFYLCMDFIRRLPIEGVRTGKYYEQCQTFLTERYLYKDIDELLQWLETLLTQITTDLRYQRGKNANLSVLKVKEYIDMHYMENITLNDMAEMVYIHPNYLSSSFKKVTGERFIDYIIKKRMDEAARMLALTQLSVGEIARRVGYENVRHFSRLFSKYAGQVPTIYRELMHKNRSGG